MPWRGPEYEGEFPSLGWGVVEWWEDNLRVPSGPDWGKPFVATDEQVAYVVKLYRIDSKGRFVYRRGAKREAKGKGKSPEAAGLAIVEFAGPVRFDGWDANGDPVGIPQPTPWVQVAACSEDQTGNTYSALFEMLRESPAVDDQNIDIGKTRVNFYGRPGVIEPVTSAAASREGQPVTFAVLDETHLWLAGNGGRRLANTIRRNVAKMSGRTVETTNAFVPGEDSVAELTHKAWLKGGRDAAGLLYQATEAPWVEDLADRGALRKALEVAYAGAPWIDLDRLVEEIQDPATDPADARRFYLNQLVKGENRAVDPKRWDDLLDKREVPLGSRIGLGFDGSINDDSTALIATTADGYQFPIHIWTRPADAAKDWRVPRLEVHDVVEEVFAAFDVGMMLCDPAKWWTEIETWQARYGECVLAFDTNSAKRMFPACDRFSTAIAERTLSHDGDPVLRSHVLAMARKKVRVNDDEDDGRSHYVFVKSDTRKIDAGIGAVLSLEAAMTMEVEEPDPEVLFL